MFLSIRYYPISYSLSKWTNLIYIFNLSNQLNNFFIKSKNHLFILINCLLTFFQLFEVLYHIILIILKIYFIHFVCSFIQKKQNQKTKKQNHYQMPS